VRPPGTFCLLHGPSLLPVTDTLNIDHSSGILQSLSKTTKYEDILDNVCLYSHYLANTEFEVTGGWLLNVSSVIDSCLVVYKY
jgi:hypothetical protein